MVNIQIVEYIKQQMAAGADIENIKSLLRQNHWPDADISDALKSLGIETPVQAPVAPIASIPVASAPVAAPVQPQAPVQATPVSGPMKKSTVLIIGVVYVFLLVIFCALAIIGIAVTKTAQEEAAAIQ